MTIVSPGVYVIEKDNSVYVSELSSTLAAIVGTAEKGPANAPTLITSAKQYVEVFGNLNPNHYMGYASLAYLKKGTQLWVTRVTPSDAKKAMATIPVPSGYDTYQGLWELLSVDTTRKTATFQLSDYTTAYDARKVIKDLPTDTVIDRFLFNDSTGTHYANGKTGATLQNAMSYAIGQSIHITLGPGTGYSGVIENITSDTDDDLQVELSTASFPSNNSPVTAAAMTTISGMTTSPAAGTNLITLATDGVHTLTLAAAATTTSEDLDTLITSLSSTYKEEVLDALETLVAEPVAGVTKISWPILIEGSEHYKTNKVLYLILNGLLNVVAGGLPAYGAYPNLDLFYTYFKFTPNGSTTSSVGRATPMGRISGYSKVTAEYDGLGNVIAIKLTAIPTGVAGTFNYSTQAIAPYPGLLYTNMVIRGSFTTGMHRPRWAMTTAGDQKVTTYLKVTGLGECDLSNTCITLGFNKTRVDSTGTLLYTLKVYERNTAENIALDSVTLQDFSLVEQYDGSLETIKSLVDMSSRRITIRLDYDVNDIYDYFTDAVELDSTSPEYLSVSPVLYTEDLGDNVVTGIKMTVNADGTTTKLVTSPLGGGSIGSIVTDEDIIGDSASRTGLYSFANPEETDVNVLLAPGYSSSPSVAKAMVSICESRGDAIAIIDTPFAMTVQEVVNFRKNVLNINSSYGAIYYPWIQVTDSVNKKEIFTPPSGYVAAQYAYNDQIADVHYAPAGRSRGNITDALAAERILTQGDRDVLYTSQINPIHTESSYGIYIKGQRTLQVNSSALDRVNVRRLFLQLRKVVATASAAFEFEPNDTVTAYKLKQIIESVLDARLRSGAIQSYTVDVSAAVNTLTVKENNQLRAEIAIVPTKAAEAIVEVFNILPQGGGVSIS